MRSLTPKSSADSASPVCSINSFNSMGAICNTKRVMPASVFYTPRGKCGTPSRNKIHVMNYAEIAGARIRQAREAAGLERDDLAERIGVGYSTIANYEQGTRYPKPNHLSKLAKVLGMPVGYLSGLETDKQAEALLLLYTKSDRRGKETIFRVAESQSTPYNMSESNDNNGKTGT